MTRPTIGFLVTLALSLLMAPLAAAAQPRGKIPLVDVLRPTSSTDPLTRRSGKGCATSGTWRGTTFALSAGSPRASTSGCPSWRPNWSGCRSTSSSPRAWNRRCPARNRWDPDRLRRVL